MKPCFVDNPKQSLGLYLQYPWVNDVSCHKLACNLRDQSVVPITCDMLTITVMPTRFCTRSTFSVIGANRHIIHHFPLFHPCGISDSQRSQSPPLQAGQSRIGETQGLGPACSTICAVPLPPQISHCSLTSSPVSINPSIHCRFGKDLTQSIR